MLNIKDISQQPSKNVGSMLNKKGQEEMVGFVLIVVLVSVVLMTIVIITIMQPKDNTVNSYEAETFLQAVLSYTTDCSNTQGKVPIQMLVFYCFDKTPCLDNKDSCAVLEKTLNGITKEAWKIKDRPAVGYKFTIFGEEDDNKIEVKAGNETSNSFGASQSFVRSGRDAELRFNVYY